MSRVALVSAVLGALVACSAQASDDSAAVKKNFIAKFPQREVVAVSPTPVSGIYEVVLPGRQVVYTNKTVSHMFVGDLIDVGAKKSLTEEKVAALSKVDWASLPLNLAIKDVRGNGSRQLAVFSDPDCPFCKKLEREGLAGIDNVTIYTFLLPITQLHPDAMKKSAQIWCAPDRLATWSGFMREDRALPSEAKCATPLAEIQQLGAKLGIQGTPALIFAHGQLVPGAIAKADIERLLNVPARASK